MGQSTQERVMSLLNTFFQEFLDYKFKEIYGQDWYQKELLPFIRSYVDGNRTDGDINYEKYRTFLNKNYENCRKQDIDVSFACAILLFEKKYDFQFSENLRNVLNALRSHRNDYGHATDYDEFERLSLNSTSIVDLKNAIDLIGPGVFSKDFSDEIESVKTSISMNVKPDSNSYLNKESEVKSVLEQEYTKAEGLFFHQNYSDAYTIHFELAQCGFARSAARIGEFYQYGYGVEQNLDTAIEWYDKAKSQEDVKETDPAARLKELKKTIEEAEQGSTISQLKLGIAYEEGKDVAPDIEKAVEWYEKSMQQGISAAKNRILELLKIDNPSSWYLLGTYYEMGKIFPKDTDKAIEQYKKVLEDVNGSHNRQKAWDRLRGLAEQNNTAAQFELGRYLESGVVVKCNYTSALRWYEKASELGHEKARGRVNDVRVKAAEQGDAEAQFKLGRMYAEENIKARDYKKAVVWYKKAAEQGHSEARYSLAVMYDAGLGVNIDRDEAARLYRSAAEQGNISAQYEVARMYENGQGIEKDLKEAFKWYHMAAEQGHIDAEVSLGRIYAAGTGTEHDYIEAEKWYKKAAEKGNANALNMLYMMYEKGWGVEPNFEEALKWYLKAAEAGNIDAQYKLGTMYKNGSGVARDYAEGANWYKRAAESGHIDAQFKLGKMLERGQGVPQDYEKAAYWYEKAAHFAHKEAQFRLGKIYENGLGTKQDYKKAESWFKKAAHNGYEKAKNYIDIISIKCSVQDGKYELANELGIMYENGRGVEQDYEEAVKWYKNAAEHGYWDGHYNMGRMYENGLGVKQDYIESERWYVWAAKNGHAEAKSSFDAISIKAAELGEAYAMYNLGTMYENGRIVPQDYTKAYEWYLKAAELGNMDAMLNTARMYENGLGLNVSLTEAARWYEKAAEQGNCEAEFHIGVMYENGLGVKLDSAEAIKWYEKAAEAGFQKAREYLFTIYRKAAENGDEKAKNKLARMYFEGKSVKQDYAEAARWYLDLPVLESPVDQYNLGMIYEDGLGVKQDYKEAVRWYEYAACSKYINAMNNLGRMYQDGKGVEQDYIKAVILYDSAACDSEQAKRNLEEISKVLAEPGYENIQCALGGMYEKGLEVNKNADEAYKWYSTAAEHGHGKAQYWLAEHLLQEYNKKKISGIYMEAIEWFKKGAEQRVVEAQYKLGAMYYSGVNVELDYSELSGEEKKEMLKKDRGTELSRRADTTVKQVDNNVKQVVLLEKDFHMADRWLSAPANQGYADAQYKLAHMYSLGFGVAIDHKKAVGLCEKAAEQGHPEAIKYLSFLYERSRLCLKTTDKSYGEFQHKLALLYENGQGVEKDLDKALWSYKRAAEAQYSEAQYKLGTIYENGWQVKQNLEEAEKWYKRASKSGHEAAREAYKRLKKGFLKFGL